MYRYLAIVLLAIVAPAVTAQDFFLKKGDVVVMMGDSITEQRLYSTYVEIWSQTRFPSHNLVFRNVGIGGDTSGGGNGRFKRDVLTHKPTVLTVDFGMNDGGYLWVGKIFTSKKTVDKKEIVTKKEFTQADIDARYATYMKGQQGIADQAAKAKIRVAWITPQPVEHNPGDQAELYNKALEKFSAGVGDIAKKNEGLFVDQFHPYWAVIDKARKAGEKGRITGGDAVHPGPAGQAMMAAAIMKGMNLPRVVSSVSLDAKGGSGKPETKNCTIDAFKIHGEGIAFQRKDAALPFFPDASKSILKHAPLLEEMNDYHLKVTGLQPNRYEVSLGDKAVGYYSDAELAKGVNLAEPALKVGPVADQVKDIVKAITDKTNYYHGQIYAPLVLSRNIAKNPDFKDVAKEDIAKRRDALIAERMQKMPELDAAIRKALEPRSHLVNIVRVPPAK